MKLPRRNFLHLAAGAAALPVASRFANAQSYPSRPVRLIVPWPAGGVVDLYARLISQVLSERMGQQSDAIGAFATPLPSIVWVVDLITALLLFLVLGRQWLLLPGLAPEAILGFGVLPFWLLVVGAIAVLGTPRPTFERR